MASIPTVESGRPAPAASIVQRIRLKPLVLSVITALYVGGVAYGFIMKLILLQPWYAGSLNLAALLILGVFVFLMRRGRAGFPVVMMIACVAGVVLFTGDSVWWVYGNLREKLAVTLVGFLGSALFASLIIIFLRPAPGLILLGASIAVHCVLLAIVNSRYSLAYLGLLFPSLGGYGVVLLILRRALDEIIRSAEVGDQVSGALDLANFKITAGEYRCILGIIQGLTTKEIADGEHTSTSAINNRLSSCYHKLNVIDRTQLVYLLSSREWRHSGLESGIAGKREKID